MFATKLEKMVGNNKIYYTLPFLLKLLQTFKTNETYYLICRGYKARTGIKMELLTETANNWF